MKASEGKPGRIFMLRLEEGDSPVAVIEGFAAEKKILTAQVFLMARESQAGIIVPDADDRPVLLFPGGDAVDSGVGVDGYVMIQEVAGIGLRKVLDPASGRETIARVPTSRTRVMEKAAPTPEDVGPGTIPVYLFNAEFN